MIPFPIDEADEWIENISKEYSVLKDGALYDTACDLIMLLDKLKVTCE